MSEQSVRLAKRMAELGLCSRREADEFIEQGLVRVDGVVVRVLGSRVEPQQQIELTRPQVSLSDLQVTLLLYKPADMKQPVTALIREETHAAGDRSGIEFRPRHSRQLTPAGALDPEASGLVVLTQDGRLLRKLAECEMEFLVQVDAAPEAAALKQLCHGMSLDGVALPVCKVTRQSDRQLRFVLHAPRARQIARMCELAGIRAGAVRCIRIGRIALGDLKPGEWRYLMPFERF